MDTNPAHTPAPRCGCRVPLVYDRAAGWWRHLDDLSRCDPDRPRLSRRPAPPRPNPAVYAQVITYLRSRPSGD